MSVSFTHNMADVIATTKKLHPQFRFAAAHALTQTAKKAQLALYFEMDSVWDRPDPFSKRSLFIKPATKQNLETVVRIKDRFPSKSSLTPEETYAHQYFGGRRARKASEKMMERAGLISSNEWLAPSAGARFDAYGNLNRGMIMQIISQLRLGSDPNQWQTKSDRSKRSRKVSGGYFWSRGGHLSRGVWMRRGRVVIQVMKVVGAHDYKATMDIGRTSTAVFDEHLAKQLDASFDFAKATAR